MLHNVHYDVGIPNSEISQVKFALKMMNFALKMMNFAFKMMIFASKMMDSALKMMISQWIHGKGSRLHYGRIEAALRAWLAGHRCVLMLFLCRFALFLHCFCTVLGWFCTKNDGCLVYQSRDGTGPGAALLVWNEKNRWVKMMNFVSKTRNCVYQNRGILW